MRKIPIRLKIALSTAALVVATVVMFAVFTFANFYHEQLEVLDWDLEAAGRRIADLPTAGDMRQAAGDMTRYEPRSAFAIFHDDGRVLAQGGDMGAELARNALREMGAVTASANNRGWRMMAFRHGKTSIVVAQNMDEVHEVMSDLVIAYALSLPLAALLCALGAWWIAGCVLKPVRALTDAAENMQAEKLDQRVPVPLACDDVQRLALVLNSMLARLEKSFEQAQRFSADASHELRTPLTILRGEVDQLMREPGLRPEHENRLVSIQEEIARLQRTTESLLMFARFDSGRAMIRGEPFDFSALVREACGDAELLAIGAGVRIEADIAAGVRVNGDDAHIRRILLNLFENAVKFNVRDGRIACSLAETTSDGKRVAVFRIGNTGAGIPGEKRARLFQRFFRADESRERTHAASAGTGLGLSLSREIARAHNGELVFDETAGEKDWTQFTLTLPQP